MERTATPERKGIISTRTEALIGSIDNGSEIRGTDIIAPEAIRDGFNRLQAIHAEAGREDDPTLLAHLLREAGRTCKKIENPVRALYAADAVVDLARMDFGAAHGDPPDDLDLMPPPNLPPERRMPSGYYDTLRLLVATNRDIDSQTAVNYRGDVMATQQAATAVGNSNYGKIVQRAVLSRLQEVGASEDELFKAYITVPNKVRLPGHYIVGNELERAQAAVDMLMSHAEGEEYIEERLGNYIRGAHDAMGAAMVLRCQAPRLSPDECVAALYANAATIGMLAERFTSANPLDHKLETHDAALLLARVARANFTLDYTGDSPYPRLVIPVGVPNADEFPQHIFSNDPAFRMQQEELVARQRRNASRCPIRHTLKLLEGKTKSLVEEFDTDIKDFYGVDAGIFTASGELNPAALTIARVIQAGVWTGTPERNLWTHGFEEFGVPAAGSRRVV